MRNYMWKPKLPSAGFVNLGSPVDQTGEPSCTSFSVIKVSNTPQQACTGSYTDVQAHYDLL